MMETLNNGAVDAEGFGVRLRTLRRKHQLSQKQFGARCGLHHTHISRYENGTSRPTADALKRMADVLEVPGDYLLDGEEAVHRLKRKELLLRFEGVAELPPEDQAVVVQFLDAFLLRRKMESFLHSHSLDVGPL